MFCAKSAIHAVPSACSRWPPVGKGALPVEHADVVEAEEPALEHVLAEPVLAIHPPGEVQRELVEGRLEEVEVGLASQRPLGTVQEQRGPGMDRWVYIAEVPLVGRQLAARVQVESLEHQLHLML